MAEKFIIIDGNSLANRAFYAIPMLSNSQGFITNAVYGFANMLTKLLQEEKPEYLAVAFDKGKIVFRHQEFAEYKAQRKGMPDELRPQIPMIKNILQAMNLAIFELEGFEADDLIGTLVKKAEEEGLQTMVVTGDRDALQLVSSSTKVLLTRKGISEIEAYDESTLQEKYGLTPPQIIDLKGLMGDTSDNIPGIPGVGEKTALKLLHQYGNLEQVLANAHDFQGKKLEKLLVEYADQARLSRKLATIDCCVPVTVDLSTCRVQDPDYPKLQELYRELEFKNLLQSLIEQVGQKGSTAMLNQDRVWEATGLKIEDEETLRAYLEKCQQTLTILLTTVGEGVAGSKVKSLALKVKEQEPVFLSWQEEEGLKEYFSLLKPYLENEKLTKQVFDGKRLILALAPFAIKTKGPRLDLFLMAYLLNPSRPLNNFSSILQEYAHVSWREKEEPALSYLQLKAMEELAPKLRELLTEQEMGELYENIELPLSDVLAEMELTGVRLDRQILANIGQELEEGINSLTREIYQQVGEEFNINSPKQLGVVLFEKLGLPTGKKTKIGYSTNAEVLESLASQHEVVAKILQYRQLVKLKSTYVDGLQAIIDSKTDKVHTSFNQAVTATGRLSSTEPNLQNIPIRMEEGRRIRKAFLPSPGNILLTADYSQIELRVLAHIAQDRVLINSFCQDEDIHTRTAAEVFGVPMELVSKEMRRAAKAVNFGIVYGISDFGLSQDLGISRAEAKAYIDSYFARYEGVRGYIDQIIQEAREKGYVTTLLKRRRYLPDILSRNFHLRSFAERTAMNTPIQGSAADIIKLAMLRLQEVLEKEYSYAKMILQVHDELIFDVPGEKAKELGQIVNKIMSQAYPLAVPLKVDLHIGPNWYELEKLEV